MMAPEKRFYQVEGSATTEAAIHTTWLADLYLTVGEQQPDGAWSIHAFHNPLVPWIWTGAIFTALGGGVSLTDRRHRVGAPVRAARAAART
jgi:cytochrome c-type biogenesis protein CcmF